MDDNHICVVGSGCGFLNWGFGSLHFIWSSPVENSINSPVPYPVDKALREMELANVAFNAPSIINIDDATKIELKLSLSDTIEQLKQYITETGEKHGEKNKGFKSHGS